MVVSAPRSSGPRCPARIVSAFDKAFPFVVNAPSIDPNPIFTRDIIILGTYPGRDKGDKDDDKGDRGGKGKDRGDDSKPSKKAEKKSPPRRRRATAKKNLR